MQTQSCLIQRAISSRVNLAEIVTQKILASFDSWFNFKKMINSRFYKNKPILSVFFERKFHAKKANCQNLMSEEKLFFDRIYFVENSTCSLRAIRRSQVLCSFIYADLGCIYWSLNKIFIGSRDSAYYRISKSKWQKT